jgi:hypothetical protein
MALLHALHSVAKYMSDYVQLPVFVASLCPKKLYAELYICTEQDTLLQRNFYAAVPPIKVRHEPITVLFQFV